MSGNGRKRSSIRGRPPPIAQCLRHMHAPNRLRTLEIGYTPAHSEYPVIAARRQPHRLRRLGEKLAPRLVGRRHRIEQRPVHLGVSAHALAVIARRLDVTGGGDPRGHFRRSLGRRGGKTRLPAKCVEPETSRSRVDSWC